MKHSAAIAPANSDSPSMRRSSRSATPESEHDYDVDDADQENETAGLDRADEDPVDAHDDRLERGKRRSRVHEECRQQHRDRERVGPVDERVHEATTPVIAPATTTPHPAIAAGPVDGVRAPAPQDVGTSANKPSTSASSATIVRRSRSEARATATANGIATTATMPKSTRATRGLEPAVGKTDREEGNVAGTSPASASDANVAAPLAATAPTMIHSGSRRRRTRRKTARSAHAPTTVANADRVDTSRGRSDRHGRGVAGPVEAVRLDPTVTHAHDAITGRRDLVVCA